VDTARRHHKDHRGVTTRTESNERTDDRTDDRSLAGVRTEKCVAYLCNTRGFWRPRSCRQSGMRASIVHQERYPRFLTAQRTTVAAAKRLRHSGAAVQGSRVAFGPRPRGSDGGIVAGSMKEPLSASPACLLSSCATALVRRRRRCPLARGHERPQGTARRTPPSQSPRLRVALPRRRWHRCRRRPLTRGHERPQGTAWQRDEHGGKRRDVLRMAVAATRRGSRRGRDVEAVSGYVRRVGFARVRKFRSRGRSTTVKGVLSRKYRSFGLGAACHGV
jgi:hypothetical protein